MYFFKFEVPLMPDGKKVVYSPNWFGTMAKCPKNVTVLLFNDADGYGIASSTDTFKPPEVTVITEAEALAELTRVSELPEINFEQDKKKLPPGKLTADGRVAEIWYGSRLDKRTAILKARDDKVLVARFIAEANEAMKLGVLNG